VKKAKLFVIATVICCVLCSGSTVVVAAGADTGLAATDAIGNVPKVVGEDVATLSVTENIDKLWKASGQISVEKSSVKRLGKDTLQINYWLRKANDSVHLDYQLVKGHPVAERVRFWLKGDGSGSVLRVLCYHTLSSSWLNLATIQLNFHSWRHLEIPASNPIYRYYSSATAF